MRRLMILSSIMVCFFIVSIGFAQDTTSTVKKTAKKHTLTKEKQQTNSKKQSIHFIKEDCLAATTISMLIQAESIANRGDEEELRDYMLKYYPFTVVLKQGGQVKIVDSKSNDNFVRVRPIDDERSYWMEKNILE